MEAAHRIFSGLFGLTKIPLFIFLIFYSFEALGRDRMNENFEITGDFQNL